MTWDRSVPQLLPSQIEGLDNLRSRECRPPPELPHWPAALPCARNARPADRSVATQLLVAGSYNSALSRIVLPLSLPPPTTSTLPSCNTVAVCSVLGTFIRPVAVHIPVVGSYSSALSKTVAPLFPPATKTMPLG